MTIDELILSIALRLDKDSLKGLQDISKALDDLEDKAEKSGKSMDKTAKKNAVATRIEKKNSTELMKVFAKRNKSFADSINVTSMMTRALRSFAVAAIGGATAGAAFNLMLKDAKAGKELQDVADGLGMNASQLGLWESAIRSAGLSAEGFRSDLKSIFKEYTNIDFDQILRDADEINSVRLKEGYPEAVRHAESLGYSSQDSIRFLSQGREKILDKLEESRRLGHEKSAEQIKNNTELALAWARANETLDKTIGKMTAALSPGFTKALDAITQGLANNQAAFEAWSKSAGNIIGSFVDEATGNIETLENRMAQFNEKPAKDNVASPDETVRDKQFEELADDVKGRELWDIGRTAAGLVGNVFELLGGEFNFGKTLEDAAERRKRIRDPIERARYHEQRLSEGDDSSAIDQMVPDLAQLYPFAKEEDLEALARSRLGLSAPGIGAGAAEDLRARGVSEETIRDIVAGVTPELMDRVKNAGPDQTAFHRQMRRIFEAKRKGDVPAESKPTSLDRLREVFTAPEGARQSVGDEPEAYGSSPMPFSGGESATYTRPNPHFGPADPTAERLRDAQRWAFSPVSPTYEAAPYRPERLVYFPPPQPRDFERSGPTDIGGMRSGGDNGGVHIENQNVNIEINGATDPMHTSDRVVRRISMAAKYGDHIPYFQ